MRTVIVTDNNGFFTKFYAIDVRVDPVGVLSVYNEDGEVNMFAVGVWQRVRIEKPTDAVVEDETKDA